MKKILIFSTGAACFLASQVLTRIPLINYINGNSLAMQSFRINHILLSTLLAALSAGIFEEAFRFAARSALPRLEESLFSRLKSSPPEREAAASKWDYNISEPVIFGIGHSMMEIVYIFIIMGGLRMIFEFGTGMNILLPFAERLTATIIHIEMSIIIWEGFAANKKYLSLLIAVSLHTLIDFTPALITLLDFSILGYEIFLFCLAILILISLYYAVIRKRGS